MCGEFEQEPKFASNGIDGCDSSEKVDGVRVTALPSTKDPRHHSMTLTTSQVRYCPDRMSDSYLPVGQSES